MWPLFKVVNLLYLMVSSYAWFAFLLPGNLVPVLVSGFMILCYAFGNFNVKMTPRVYGLMGVIILYSLYGFFILGTSFGSLTFFSYLPAVLIFMLDVPKQTDLLRFVTKWLSIIMAVSLGVYFITYVVDLPHTTFYPRGLENYLPFDNYFFLLKSKMYGTEFGNIVRFSGPFLEPGHQSMICSLLLFANRFKFREQPLMWVLLASVFVSLSLAGYLILAVGYLLVKLRNVYAIGSVAAVFITAWLTITVFWNDGNNIANVLIVERLEFDDNKGIKGNNRTIKQTDYFYKECVRDGTIWLGVRTQKADKLKIRGAGYKIFLIRYGIVASLFVLTIYIMLINPQSNKRYSYSFLLLMAIIFLQRAYPGWYSWLLPYVLGIGIMRHRTFSGKFVVRRSSIPEVRIPVGGGAPQSHDNAETEAISRQ